MDFPRRARANFTSLGTEIQGIRDRKLYQDSILLTSLPVLYFPFRQTTPITHSSHPLFFYRRL
jgi:hypothetical protein